MVISLAEMKANQKGMIVGINGGHAMSARLYTMGIQEGVRITRKNAQPMRGPVVLEVANSSLAIGFGMAQKIMADVSE